LKLEHAERLLGEVVEPVVQEMAAAYAELPSIMVVGAISRDALHAACGHTTALRSTDDLDIALAVTGPDHFDALTARLQRVPTSTSTIRFSVAGLKVDLVPFGEPIESPDGVVTPTGRDWPMSVFGFQDVLEAAYTMHLPGGAIVHLPSIAGYTVLKLKAWIDRSAVGQYKDAADLACAMYWYLNSTEADALENASDRLYGTPQGEMHLLAADLDEPMASVRLLIDDALSVLAPTRRDQLRRLWASPALDDALLAANLANPMLPGWPMRGTQRLSDYAQAIRSAMDDVT